MKGFRFWLLSLMIVAAMIVLGGLGICSETPVAAFVSKADQYDRHIFELTFLFPGSIHYDESILPIGSSLHKDASSFRATTPSPGGLLSLRIDRKRHS